MAVGVATLIAFLFTVSVRFMYQGGKIQMIEWDCSTVTAGDYTVEFPMKADGYLKWRDDVYEAAGGPMEARGEAPAYALKKQMSQEIEAKLDAWIADQDNSWALEALYGSSKKNKKSQYGGTKVADIVFSFANSRLIEALRARGATIAAQDFDAMREKEVEINDLFQDFDALTTPTAAFITFETDDSAVLADLVKGSHETLIGNEFKFDKCSEPTDIIWENRHFTNWDYIKRQALAYVVIAFLLFGSFVLVYWISAVSAEMAAVYPPTDCDSLKIAYGTKLQDYAIKDFDFT